MLFLIQSAGCPAEYFYLLLSYPILPALASSAQRKTRQNARFSFGLHRTFPALQIQASMGHRHAELCGIALKKGSGKLPLLVKAPLIQKISNDTARKPHRRQQLSDLRRRAAAFTRDQPVRYDDLCCQKIWVFNVVDGLVGGFHAELVGVYIHGGQLRAGNA